jgi:hypothetical protein
VLWVDGGTTASRRGELSAPPDARRIRALG